LLPSNTDWSSVDDLDFDLDSAVRRDVEAIMNCDMIYMLRGWDKSTGAKAEWHLAKWMGKKIEYQKGTDETMESTEERITSDTGAQKGRKLARFELLPCGPMWELAEHFGKGCSKYSDRNWEAGYEWSLSYGACMRHLQQFWGGEDIDPETGTKHVIAAAWHCLAMAQFMDQNPDKDDRAKGNG